MRTPEEIGFIAGYENLPEVVKKELCFGKTDEFSDKIINVLYSYKGIANIDEIIIGMYKTFNIIKSRNYYVGKLYKMAHKHLINSVKGKKGIYTTLDYKK